MDQHPGWSEYLDALESYLHKVAGLLDGKSLTVVPTLKADQPAGPIPPAQSERAAALLSQTRLVESSVANWVDEVLSSMRSVEARRRVEPANGSGCIRSIL